MPCKDDLPDFVGRYIANRRLHLLELIGAGAYGKVYKARDTTSPKSDSTFYAVKCMSKHDPGTRRDMHQKREFALHARVARHPNIVTFYDVIEKGLYVHVILDICPGGDLHSAIVHKRLFYGNDALLRDAFLQILDAVEFCHQMGVYHRDIKPDNILCSDDGTRVYLADFGLATTVARCKDFGCGSLFYKSPECMGSLKHVEPNYGTQESDIWSLGVVLVNMITGRCPWRMANPKDPSFYKAVHDPEYFQSSLPMSLPAIGVAKRAFDLDPITRITIPQLRDDITSVTTFFLTDRELALAADQVLVVAGYLCGKESLPATEGFGRGVPVRMRARQFCVENVIPRVSVEPTPSNRHRAPSNTAQFPPPRLLMKKVVQKLKNVSRTSSSLSLLPCSNVSRSTAS